MGSRRAGEQEEAAEDKKRLTKHGLLSSSTSYLTCRHGKTQCESEEWEVIAISSASGLCVPGFLVKSTQTHILFGRP